MSWTSGQRRRSKLSPETCPTCTLSQLASQSSNSHRRHLLVVETSVCQPVVDLLSSLPCLLLSISCHSGRRRQVEFHQQSIFFPLQDSIIHLPPGHPFRPPPACTPTTRHPRPLSTMRMPHRPHRYHTTVASHPAARALLLRFPATTVYMD